MHYGFLSMFSHCFPRLTGVAVGFSHTDGFTVEVDNPYDVILLELTYNVSDTYWEDAYCFVREKQFGGTMIDVQLTFGKPFAVRNPFLDT